MNPGLVTISNFILIYAKDKTVWSPNRVYVPVSRDNRYNHYITNFKASYKQWKFSTLRTAFALKYGFEARALKKVFGRKLEYKLEAFVLDDPRRVVRLARVRAKDVNAQARKALQASIENPNQVFRSKRDSKADYYFKDGQQCSSCKRRKTSSSKLEIL